MERVRGCRDNGRRKRKNERGVEGKRQRCDASPWSIGSVHFKFRLRRGLQKPNEKQVHSPHDLLERERGCRDNGSRKRKNEQGAEGRRQRYEISPLSIGSVQFKLKLRRRLKKTNENQVHSPHGLLEREKGKGCVDGMEGGRERLNEELKG